MSTISLRRQATIVAIVTEEFKQQATAELQTALQQIDMESQQLEFQGKRAIADAEKKGATPADLDGLKAQINEHRQRISAQKADFMGKLEGVGQLELGSEFVQGQVDNFVDVKTGDMLYAKMASPVILVKDGIVQEIRGEM
jgi:hypothetical protein